MVRDPMRLVVARRPIYHLSAKNLDNVVLKPKVPRWPMDGEDDQMPRVCFSYSITGALGAIAGIAWPSDSTFWVHVPIMQEVAIVPNCEVRKHVPDAHLSKEVWVLEPVRVRAIARVKATTIVKEVKYRSAGQYWLFRVWEWKVVKGRIPEFNTKKSVVMVG